MEEKNISIKKIKEEIKKLKLEILEKEKKVDKLLEIIESDEEESEVE